MSISFNPTTPQLNVFPGQFQCRSISHLYYSVALPPTLVHYRIIPSVVSSSTQIATSARMPVSRYLIERLGFSEELSLTVSSKLISRRTLPTSKTVTDLISYENADTVIAYLQEYCGLELSHIKKAVSKYPMILAANVDNTIKPKVKLLEDLGFSTSDLVRVLSVNPRFYLDRDLSPVILTLRGVMGNDEDVVKVLKQITWGTANGMANNLIPNLNMLENEYGISNDKIRTFLIRSPQSLLRKTEWLRDELVKVEHRRGISRDSTQFLRALNVFSSFTDDNINSKYQVFRSYGWSDSDILSLIRRLPDCLNHSEAGMKKKLDFYVTELAYEPAYLASRPSLFSYSLENRVVPRYRLLSILKEKRLVKAQFKLYNAIAFTDEKFFDRFILPYQNDVPELRELYVNGCTPGLPADN